LKLLLLVENRNYGIISPHGSEATGTGAVSSHRTTTTTHQRTRSRKRSTQKEFFTAARQ